MGYSRQEENWKFSSNFAINLDALTTSSEYFSLIFYMYNLNNLF
jgi:hypothetical protein